MIASAEGGTGFLHRSRCPQLGEEEQRCQTFFTDVKEKGWGKHWQCNTEVQDLKDKELRSSEDGWPSRMNIKKAARRYKWHAPARVSRSHNRGFFGGLALT